MTTMLVTTCITKADRRKTRLGQKHLLHNAAKLSAVRSLYASAH